MIGWVALLAASIILILWRGVAGARSQLLMRSIVCGPDGSRCIALTFDDGPSPGTVALARYLTTDRIRATFFVCGANVLRHPEIVRGLLAAGHEVGNHTFSHTRLCPRLGWRVNLLSPATVYREVAQAQAVIEASTGYHPRLLRAPYGLRWFGLRRAQRHFGLLGVHWTVIGHDWEWSAEDVAAHVLAQVSPGGIVCLHDGRDTRSNPDIGVTLAAVRLIVPELKRRGYRFVTVSEMLRQDTSLNRLHS